MRVALLLVKPLGGGVGVGVSVEDIWLRIFACRAAHLRHDEVKERREQRADLRPSTRALS